VEQLRGIEGARVREMYQRLAKQYRRRAGGPATTTPKTGIRPTCPTAAVRRHACLYGVTEAAVLAAGYAPAVGFIHTGKPLSFVYDVADVYKFETVVPAAFKVAAKAAGQPGAGGASGLPRHLPPDAAAGADHPRHRSHAGRRRDRAARRACRRGGAGFTAQPGELGDAGHRG
jgi:hypothetical protein